MASSSLQARLIKVQALSVLLFLIGAAIFSWRMTSMDLLVERHFDTAARLRLLDRVAEVAEVIEEGQLVPAERQFLRSLLEEEAERIGPLDDKLSWALDLARTALNDGLRGGAQLAAHRADIVALRRELGKRARLSEREYRTQRLPVAFAWTAILVLPLALAVWPLRLSASVIHGIGLLGRKVAVGLQGGEPSSVPIRRDDEVAKLGHDIDDMFAELRRRELEASVARQLELEQQKLTDLVNLSGGIAHEVANPLSVILAHLDCLEESVVLGRPAGEEIDQIREGLQRIQDLLRDVTALSAGEGGVGLVDVNAVAASALRVLRLDDRVRGNRFETSLDPEVPAVTFSRPAVTLAVFSLLSLAVALLRDRKGVLVMSSRVAGAAVELAVKAGRAERRAEPLAVLHLDNPFAVKSLVRVLQGYGGDLVVVEMNPDVLEFRLVFPLPPTGDQGEAA